MKKFILVFLIATIFSCNEEKKRDYGIQNYLPQNSELILITPDVDQFLTGIENNEFLNQSDFSLKRNISEQLSYLTSLNFNSETAFSFSRLSSNTPIYTLITKQDSSLIPLDSIQNKIVETVKEAGLEFNRISIGENKFFLLEKNEAVVISNSKQNIINTGNQENLLRSGSFAKALQAADNKITSVFLNHELLEPSLSKLFSQLKFPGIKNIAGWSVLDVDLTEAQIRTNGLSLINRENSILKAFQSNEPQQSEIGKICPDDFISYFSVSFSDYEKFYKNTPKYEQDSTITEYPGILDHTREAAIISLINGDALALNIHEIVAGKEALAGLADVHETYRGADIFKLSEAINFQDFFPELLQREIAQYYAIQDHFVIFASEPEVIKSIITAYQNSGTLINKSYFNELANALSSETSMLFVINPEVFTQHLDTDKSSQDFKFNKNSLAALQVVSEDNFAHLHGIFSNSAESTAMNGPEQSLSIKLEAPLTTKPYFFKNHRTDQMDIAVQDDQNNLHLISNKGNIFWKRNLDSQITSPIYQVDLFKNGNQQLAFSTGYHMEVLDRNGKKVKGWPIKFNQPLTQPLAVFDYDNNRTYRFVLTQNKKVYMVGPKGKAIKGFDFENAGSKVTSSPKHVRLGSKDYILISEESGRLNILSRQGKIRVPVTETLKFSANEWYGYQNSFVSTNPDKNLVKISQNGNVTYT
ncbi:MAG: DUF3352 domain-containing protein, partial [Gramella sp.]|nr:DUF3352 domain-containing protein [Christiangramia sp.]